MKKVILSALIAMFSVLSFAQTQDSVIIYKSVDDMTDEVLYFPSRKIVCIDDVTQIGFGITFFVDGKSDSTLFLSDLFVKTAGYGCVENVEVIFLFEDGSKVTCNSWNKFNCEGSAYCMVSKADKEALATKKLQKIRVTNNRNFKTYTAVIPDESKDYFIQLFNAVNSKKVYPYTDKK